MKGASLTLLLFLLACADDDPDVRAPRPAAPDTVVRDTAGPTTVTLHFTRGEVPVPVTRTLGGGTASLQAVLAAQLEGPTDAERASGLTSWFSAATAGLLRSATVDAGGRAIVDFENLAAVIPSASSSTGSAMLLGELNRTIFQHPEVRTIEYRSEGSCEAFWNWLQYDCQVVSRPAP